MSLRPAAEVARSHWCPSGTVSLILVSESLPGRSGIDLVREIHRTRPAARIVMVTSDAGAAVCLRSGAAAGAVGCVVKPLVAESLSTWLGEQAR